MAYGQVLGQKPIIPSNPNTIATNVSYNNSQTSSIITGTNVQEAIDQLFTSVSNGKSLIASAITDKGVSTSASDSFQTMANNIENIQVGGKIYLPAFSLYSFGYVTSTGYRTTSRNVNYTSDSYYNIITKNLTLNNFSLTGNIFLGTTIDYFNMYTGGNAITLGWGDVNNYVTSYFIQDSSQLVAATTARTFRTGNNNFTVKIQNLQLNENNLPSYTIVWSTTTNSQFGVWAPIFFEAIIL